MHNRNIITEDCGQMQPILQKDRRMKEREKGKEHSAQSSIPQFLSSLNAKRLYSWTRPEKPEMELGRQQADAALAGALFPEQLYSRFPTWWLLQL